MFHKLIGYYPIFFRVYAYPGFNNRVAENQIHKNLRYKKKPEKEPCKKISIISKKSTVFLGIRVIWVETSL